MAGLEPKQLRFCQEYVIDLNATQAAIRAGYSPKTAQEQSSRLLSKVMVQQKVLELQRPKEENLKITAERVLKEIAKLAFESDKPNIQVQGLKMLGEHLKLFTQMHESTTTFTAMPTVKTKDENGKQGTITFDVGKPIK